MTIRASENQKAIIRAKARNAGVSVTRFVLAVTLGSNYRPPHNPELITSLRALNLELTRQGTNLNQIAKHLNGGQTAPAESKGLLSLIARSMLKTHAAIRKTLAQGEPEP